MINPPNIQSNFGLVFQFDLVLQSQFYLFENSQLQWEKLIYILKYLTWIMGDINWYRGELKIIQLISQFYFNNFGTLLHFSDGKQLILGSELK